MCACNITSTMYYSVSLCVIITCMYYIYYNYALCREESEEEEDEDCLDEDGLVLDDDVGGM